MNLQFIKKLGSGGFGIVDLVQDEHGKTYARKTYSTSQAFSSPKVEENVKKRFAREAKIQSGINHPNIVPVIYSDIEADPPYYLMPQALCSLQDDLDVDRCLGGNWLTAINDIVTALDELHSSRIYHRDLTPRNVLKYQRNDASDPKIYYAVSDFGLIAMSKSRVSFATVTGMAKGTDHYTAPEIVNDLRRASPQSDIYSLGCILHEMVGVEQRVPCNEIREDGPYGAILLNCTRNDPKRRFQSVRSVLDAVTMVASDLPLIMTAAASEFADKLASGEYLDQDSWQSLVEYVEDHEGQSDSDAVLVRLQLDQVNELCKKFPDLADRLALPYAQWINNVSFDFKLCDSLANILEIFIVHCSFEAKSEALMAMLNLGTSHNRWYVERKLFTLCGSLMDEALAKRLAIEIRAAGEKVCEKINRLESSISVSRTGLHPVLQQTLAEICK